jgi:Tfp pilus assembly PilM family ATPase
MLRTRKTGWIGFDLGATNVKAGQVVRKGGEYLIRSGAIVPRAERWEMHELASGEPRSSADEMRAAQSVCSNLTGGVAAAVLPIALCEMAQVEVPTGQRWGRNEVVRAAEAETQQPMADRVVDWWPTTLRSGRLNVVAAQRSWSERVSADVAAVGRHCRLIDALPWALARCVAMVRPAENSRTAIAFDWGFEGATLCLIHQRTPTLVRRLKDCGYQQLVAAVQRALRLDERDADGVLQKYGLTCPGASPACAAAMSYALANPLERLERELKRTLTYWNGQARASAPEIIYLFGGGASIPGIAERLSQVADLDVRVWSLPAENSAGAGVLPAAHLLGPALGLSALALES